MLAIPETYGLSGLMTFMVNQDGIVWQRNLGQETPRLAATIEQFNPDETWMPVAPDAWMSVAPEMP